MFAGSSSDPEEGEGGVRFGDVMLSESPGLAGPPHNPGRGGWPTVRYFNAATGTEGGSYEKVTDDPMCVELGDVDNLVAYVEGKGGEGARLCSVADGRGCTGRELKYLANAREMPREEVVGSKLPRLEKIEAEEGLTAELMAWVRMRKNILTQVAAEVPVEAEL